MIFVLCIVSIVPCLIVVVLQLLRVVLKFFLKLAEARHEDLVDRVDLLLVFLLQLLVICIVRSDHMLVFFMQLVQLVIHLVQKFNDLVDLILDRASMKVRVELMRVHWVLYWGALMDSMVVVMRMLIVVVVSTLTTHAHVNDLNRMTINEDVNVHDESA